MRGIGGSTLRGGQTVFHGLRMWGQLLQAAVFLAAFMTVAVPAWTLWRSTSGAEWHAAGMVTLAEVKLAIGYDPDSGQEVRMADGTWRALRIRDIAVSVPALRARERILDVLLAGAWRGAMAGAGMIVVFLVVFWQRGVRLGRQRRLRGAEMVTARELRRRVRPPRERVLALLPGAERLGPYTIAGIPYPPRAETQHTIVSGTTGSGKTVLISDLVAQVRARGERCVIYDKMGSYTRAFYDRDRDVLMNPLDARAPRWSPFLEARGPRDFDMMAAALIPQQKDTVDPLWVTAARQLFSNGAGVLRQKGETRNRVLVDHLLKTDLTALAEAMEGTVAQSIVDPENPKTALSVRAMLTANLSALEFLPDEGDRFSIREWISGGSRDGILFLTSRGDQHASLRGLISTWLEIAVNAMLSLDQDSDRRIWVILDELPTLHQVPSLQPGLAESRQFGGCFVLGVQVASALRDLYGRNGAETISGLCGTRVVLAAPDRDTAQWSADSLGRSEIEEVAEGFSYGANTIRDGVSLTPRRELRALALPSEIMRLENLSGYLKFPGPFPVASIRLRYVKRPAAAERFVARQGDGVEIEDVAESAESGAESGTAASADGGGRAGEAGLLALPRPDEAGPARAPSRGGMPFESGDPLNDESHAAHDVPTEPPALQGELPLSLPEEAETPRPDAGPESEDGRRKARPAGSSARAASGTESASADRGPAGKTSALPVEPGKKSWY